MAIKLHNPSGSISLSQKMKKGDDGGYYIPELDEKGNLSWHATEDDMPAIEPVNIKGQKGDKGDTGKDGVTPVHIGEEEPTDDNVVIWLWTEPDVISSAEEREY